MTLTLHQVTFERQDQPVFSPVSFSLQKGECLQITGKNGAGKSTLLKLIAGLLQPTHGNIQSNHDLYYLGHKNAHQLSLTARENIILIATMLDVKLSEKSIQEILQQAGIEKLIDTPVKFFSAGQMRRLALAKLLLKPQKLWLLDEPTTALDALGVKWFENILQTHLSRGGIAVIATHDVLENIKSKIIDLSNHHCHPEQTALWSAKDLPITTGRSFVAKNAPQDDSIALTFTQLCKLTYFEILAIFREAHAWLTPLIFFLMAITLFPLAVGSDIPLLHTIAPGIIWVLALLSILLSIESIFRYDKESGRLDFVLSIPNQISVYITSKIITHWLIYALPIVLFSPLLGILLGLSFDEIKILGLSLLTGTAVLSLIGVTGAALVTGIRGSGLLLPILIMPLYIPILIFGTNIITTAEQHQPLSAYFAMMLALTLLSAIVAPIFSSLALKTGVNQ